MKQWTFGIITSGAYPLTDMIATIESQGIADEDYEIIVVGGPPLRHKNIKHIPFNEATKPNWITKKKQLVCENAKFENVVLTHDYVMFQPGWYEGWQKFGDNDWDVAMNVIRNGDGLRFRDWCVQSPLSLVPYNMVGYGPAQYISGTYWVAKKEFMLKYPLDITRGWNDWEDIEWSFRCRPHWKYKMNPYSAVQCNKVKETWGVQGDTGVQTSIHYLPLEFIMNTVGPIKVQDDNGRLKVLADPGVASIHYGEFDALREDVRRAKPKKIVVVGDPFGLTPFAAAWAAQEYGGKVYAFDYGDGSYGIRIARFFADRFQWNDTMKVQAISAPSELESVEGIDMAIFCGTYEESKKLQEIESVRKKLNPGATILFNNTHSDAIRAALPNAQQSGGFCKLEIP